MIIVSKFGGTSMANMEAMSRCASIVAQNDQRKIITVSATAGTTNDLVQLSQTIDQSEIDSILDRVKERHLSIINELKSPDKAYGFFCDQLASLKRHLADENRDKAWEDVLFSFGELMSSPIFTEVVKEHGVNASLLDARTIIRCS